MTGVDEIDRQHRVLINTLNEIIEHLADGDSDEFAERITRELLGYAMYHFETEEGLMEVHGYRDHCVADAQRHREQHHAFTARANEMRARVNSGRRVDLVALVAFLQSWLVGHIMDTDRRFGRFVLEHRRNCADV